jgi:hypothetical protein
MSDAFAFLQLGESEFPCLDGCQHANSLPHREKVPRSKLRNITIRRIANFSAATLGKLQRFLFFDRIPCCFGSESAPELHHAIYEDE